MDRTLNQVFYLPRLIGTFPFREDFTISRNRIVYSIVISALSIAFTFLFLVGLPVTYKKNILNYEYLRSVKLVVINVNCVLSLLWLSIRQRTIHKIGRYALNFPYEFKNNVKPLKFRIVIWSNFCSLLTILCLIIKSYIYLFINGMQVRRDVTMSYYHLVFMMLSYCCAVAMQFSIIGQFSGLLKIVRNLCLSVQLAPDNSQILLQYERLTWLCHCVNKAYGLPFLMYVSSTLVFTTFAVYSFILERHILHSFIRVVQIFWITSFFCPILDCIYSINQNIHQVNVT